MKHVFQWKSKKIIYIITIMLTITLSLLLLIKEEKEVVIISREYSYSIYHSDNYETIDIEVLTNEIESYHFSEDYISNTRLYNDIEEVSTRVKAIQKSHHRIPFNDEDYYLVTFQVQLPFQSNNYLIEMDDVHLEITYDNNEQVSLKIGDLQYLFEESMSNHITLSNLSATHEEVHGYNTIGGVNLELSNTSSSNIIITDIKILSNNVFTNKNKIKTNITCDYRSTVQDCLGLEDYNFNEVVEEVSMNTLLGKGNTLEFYIPLLYYNVDFIYDFAIVIEYRTNQTTERFIIDNFPYMKTSIFSTFNEDDFYVYTITNNNN